MSARLYRQMRRTFRNIGDPVETQQNPNTRSTE